MSKRWSLVGAVVLGAVLLCGAALATSGSRDDGDDTTGTLDIKRVTHDDTSSQITYTLETQGTWNPPDTPYYTIAWLLDLDADGAHDDACLVITEPTPEAAFFGGNCEDGSPPPVQENIPVNKTGNVVTVSYNRSNLGNAGFAGDSYRYVVNTFDSGAQNTDRVPDQPPGIVHSLSQPAPPTTTTTTAPAPTTTTTVCGATSTATASPSNVRPGGTTTVSGGGCFTPGSRLTITFRSHTAEHLGDATAGPDGRFSATVTIPSRASNGSHTITVSGPNRAGGTHNAVANVVVSGGRLAVTGSDSGDMAQLAGFALTLGAALVIIGRRRLLASRAAARTQVLLDDALRGTDRWYRIR